MAVNPGARSSELAVAYDACRAQLIRVAYAVLGTRAEAEDVVADCWLKLAEADCGPTGPVRDIQAWATVAVSRRALDVLRSARVQRESYIGPWLPEPVLDADPADRVTLDDTVSYALLVLLETLSPAERTAWVLHDLFGMEFARVAEIVGRSDAAVRQLAARARRHVAEGSPRVSVSYDEHRAVLEAFMLATAEGDIAALTGLLDPSVTLLSDGGGEVNAARIPVTGAAKVALFMTRIAAQLTPESSAEIADVNGRPALIIREAGALSTVMTLTVDGGRVTGITALRAPAKLRRLTG